MAPSSIKQRPRRWPWRLSLAVGTAAAAVLASMNLLGGAFACAWDTSYCATSRDDLEPFRGTITDDSGRPVGNAEFHFRDDTLAEDDAGPVFHSDPDGGYCVLWPAGSTLPSAKPLDPALRSSLVEPDHEPSAEAGDCQSSEHRGLWYRYEDRTSSWQYLLLLLLPAWTVALFAAAGLMGPHNRPRAKQLALGAGALVVLNALLYLLLWAS